MSVAAVRNVVRDIHQPVVQMLRRAACFKRLMKPVSRPTSCSEVLPMLGRLDYWWSMRYTTMQIRLGTGHSSIRKENDHGTNYA